MSGIYGYYCKYWVIPETSGLPEISGYLGLPATRWFSKLNRVGSSIRRNTEYRVRFGYPLGTAQHVAGKHLKPLDLSYCWRIEDCFVGNCQYVAFVGGAELQPSNNSSEDCNFKQFVFSSRRWIELGCNSTTSTLLIIFKIRIKINVFKEIYNAIYECRN